ncbi:hypothetical protein PI126_g10010 [Phytophthora idaei]|nr:hypothetical protein PI126_g10010 [Phytophthora idaei]
MEAITPSLADLARIEVQRSNQVASELIVLMKFAFDRLGTDNYQIYDLKALRTPKTNEQSLPRREVHISAFSNEAQVCVRKVKGQITKRFPTVTAEPVVILLLDPRTKFTVEGLIHQVFREKDAAVGGKNLTLPLLGASSSVTIDAVMEDGKTLLRNAHREVFCTVHPANMTANHSADVDMPPNLDLVPSVDDELVMCGAPLVAEAPQYYISRASRRCPEQVA